MYVFFLLINIVFSTIFYLFWRSIEAVFFLITWILLFFYFSPFYFWKTKIWPSFIDKIGISKISIKNTLPLIQRISYILAFLFFYLSIYGISYSFWWWYFEYFTLWISIILLVWFFISFKSQKIVLNTVVRSNFLVLSVYYVILFIKNLILQWNINTFFIINSIILFIGLILILVYDNLLDQYRKNNYFIFYLFYQSILIFFYVKFYFVIPLYLIIPYFLFLLGVFYFEYLPLISFLEKFSLSSRYFWLFLNYLCVFICFVLIFIIPNFWHYILILFGLSIFFSFVHLRFKNYLSLELVILTIILVYIKYFIPIRFLDFYSYLAFIYLLPAVFISFTYIVQNKYEYDNYFIHFSALIFSLLSLIIYFIITRDFDILHISVIFLLQSFLLFGSFAKLKVKNN